MRTLAPEFGVSDVALRKACVKARVPVPERGYWARLNAGKPAIRAKLPTRPPGLSETVRVGGHAYYYHVIPGEELLGPIPDPPAFHEPLEGMETEVRKLLGKVKPVRTLDSPHRALRRPLAKEDERRATYLRTGWSWDAPIFDTPFEQRRLRILNSLFMATGRLGAIPDIRGAPARDITIKIHDQTIQVRLDTPENLNKPAPYDRPDPAEPKAPMRLVIPNSPGGKIERSAWEDAKGRKIEEDLTEITVQIIMAAEHQHREGRLRAHEWRITRRTQRIEEIRLARERAEREERERQEKLARERVERLVGEADALARAEMIRTYVMRAREAAKLQGIASSDVERWAEWALETADEIDPIRSGRFLQPTSSATGPGAE